MNIPNISRRSGGAGIKLKDKWGRRVPILAGALLAGFFCYMALRFLDIYANGALLNWFTWNYTNPAMDENGNFVYGVGSINWSKVRVLVFTILEFAVVFWVCALFFAANFMTKRRSRQIVTDISRAIQRYMDADADNRVVFPREYAEIAAQMAEIQAGMQRRDQILKEEVSRKNDLIVYLAHDLKTPLTSIVGYLSLLEEAPDMPPDQKAKYVHITLQKALRLETLINEFFEITRYNLQQIVLEKEQIDLYYMLRQMADEFYPILQAHHNTVELHADENLTVFADPNKLARVFNNILKNAVAYSYAGTVINITAKTENGMVKTTIQNHGKTIPEQKLDMIFEKFFRLDSARATDTGGAGLGLAIAKDIVTLHGGTVTAQSRQEITTFCVTLPEEQR